MTKEELAAKLHGREYLLEMSKYEEQEAKNNNLVVVFGESDDLIKFRGAIEYEEGVYEGGKIYLNSEGILRNYCSDDECPYFEKEKRNAAVIEAIWSPTDDNNERIASWIYKTTIPHAEFTIYDDEYKYCIGIVFSIADLKAHKQLEEKQKQPLCLTNCQ